MSSTQTSRDPVSSVRVQAEAKNCPKKAANKRPAPVDTTRAVSNKAPRTYAEKTASTDTTRPPAGNPAADTTNPATTDGVPPPVSDVLSSTTSSAVETHDPPSGDSSARPGETPFTGTDPSNMQVHPCGPNHRRHGSYGAERRS